MCGICGYYSTFGLFSDNDLIQSVRSLAHRGPDAEGIYLDNTIGLGHRRLSIIDLSPSANQPMHSLCGKYVIVYNGEVYNYKEIAKDLNTTFKTHSDTEVVLEAFAKWKEDVIYKLNGMFAFAIYDKYQQELFLFRDRMGIKPLYYFYDGKNLAFASELKSLLKFSYIKKKLNINKKVIPVFLNLGYIPEPYTIYENIYKLPAGSYLKLSSDKINIVYYWKLENVISPFTIDNLNEAKEKLKQLIIGSVQYQLISDVPVGIFLSGGVDSTLITAVAQSTSSSSINTFSIGFKESKFNEAPYARKIANYLKTNHHEYTVTKQDAIELINELLQTYDEPFADSSAIPTMLVSKLAKQHVKTVLSGDGGDELFLGYGAYSWAHRLSNPFIRFNRKIIAQLLKQLGNRSQRAAKLFEYQNVNSIKTHIFSQEQYYFSQIEIQHLLTDKYKESISIEENFSFSRELTPQEEQAFFDLKYYLKDDLLVKIDRASMKYGLETRVPFLDHRIVELSLNISPSLKIKNGIRKYLLKEILNDYMPKEYFNRPKWGFALPIGIWLKNDLKFLLDDYLSENIIRKHEIVKYEEVDKLKNDFLSSRDYLYGRLWLLIVLHKFFENTAIGT